MEATIVCIDNSEWTRSGDYAPTRFQAQADAVNLLAGAKTQANPENTVGVLTMAGKTPRVLVTPTPDLGKVLNCMTDINIEGESNIATSVQIAQLALKHRQNKNQRQRIVIFAGSPVAEDKVGRLILLRTVCCHVVKWQRTAMPGNVDAMSHVSTHTLPGCNLDSKRGSCLLQYQSCSDLPTVL